MKATILLLAPLTVLHLVTLAMLLVATVDKSWWVWNDSKIKDPRFTCFYDNSTNTFLCAASDENDWLSSVQALMVLSVVFSSISFLAFLIQLLVIAKGKFFYFPGLCQTFAGFTTFAACLLFSFHKKDTLNDSRNLGKGHFGYVFILAWVCVPLLLISTLLYIHLHKKNCATTGRETSRSAVVT